MLAFPAKGPITSRSPVPIRRWPVKAGLDAVGHVISHHEPNAIICRTWDDHRPFQLLLHPSLFYHSGPTSCLASLRQ